MPIPEEVVRRAQDFDRRAMEQVVAEAYPSVYRMAHALTGRPGAARQVLHDVLRRGLRVLPNWRAGSIPENWFYHHTLLSARELSTRLPDPREDLLVASAADAAHDPHYVGFVRALRNLPRQQAEAFILHHGERLNDRLLGVAMDCSTGAAHTHLAAAQQALGAVSGAGVDVLTTTLERAYQSLTPPPAAIRPVARRYVSRSLRPRRVRRLVRLTLLVALLAGGYFAWRERARWLPWVQEQKSRYWPTSSPATAPAAILRLPCSGTSPVTSSWSPSSSPACS
jgi:DNA-directed RNA polymerase specialized sigma24 family protein